MVIWNWLRRVSIAQSISTEQTGNTSWGHSVNCFTKPSVDVLTCITSIDYAMIKCVLLYPIALYWIRNTWLIGSKGASIFANVSVQQHL